MACSTLPWKPSQTYLIDIAVAIGLDKVMTLEQYGQLLTAVEGKTVNFTFERAGKTFEKTLAVRALGP